MGSSQFQPARRFFSPHTCCETCPSGIAAKDRAPSGERASSVPACQRLEKNPHQENGSDILHSWETLLLFLFSLTIGALCCFGDLEQAATSVRNVYRGFRHQQNQPSRCGSASPCHCYLFPRDESYHHSPLPLGELQQTGEILGTAQSGESYKQTHQQTKKTKGSRTHKKQYRSRVVSQLASDPIHQTSHLLDYLL